MDAVVVCEPVLVPVLVGYGHAGRDLHHRSLLALGAGEVLAVDPAGTGPALPGARLMSGLDAALAALPSPEAGVFHLATPPDQRLDVVRALVAAGARNLIVEKPLARTAAGARALIAAAASARLLPVGVWPSSAVTAAVQSFVAAGRVGVVTSLRMEQSKPRFQRSRASSTHRSAFEVELPHQVLLALHLCGPVERVTESAVWPMRLPDVTLPALGGARIVLEHTSGVVSTLVSDLTSPVRVRELRLTGTEGEVIAHYPVSSDDHFGQVWAPGKHVRTLVPDAPLTRFVGDAYRYFRGEGGPPPGTDPGLHLAVMDILAEAAAGSQVLT